MRARGPSIVALACAAALYAGSAQPSLAQALFGKNKVVYADRDWKVFQEGRVHLYFYPEEEELARQALRSATEAYAEFSEYFHFEFEDPIPIILYGTHHDFKQTNVTPGFIPDFTAGFTEFAKGRVTLPASGSQAELRHVVRHELVHAFMLSKLAHVMNEHGVFDYPAPPLWFIEGLAENVARSEPDAQANMFLRDALFNEGLPSIPDLWQIEGSFLMYKAGESILGYLRTQYGDDVPAHLLESWWKGRGFSEVLQLELGLTEAKLSERWTNYLKRRYFPEMLVRSSPAERGRALFEEPRFEIAPAVLDGADDGAFRLAMISARDGLLSLYLVEVPRQGQPRVQCLVEGGRKARFEALPALRSRIDTWGGNRIAFVAKHGSGDALFVYDLARGGVASELAFPQLRQIASPTFSPDGRYLAFSGLAVDGTSDLYCVDVEDGALTALTHDAPADLHPSWHPVEPRLVFASDRDDLEGGRRSLYELDLDASGRAVGPPRRLTDDRADDNEPAWSADGARILYVSDRSGTFNLHVLEQGVSRQITSVTGGAYNPDWVPGESGGVVASVYHKGTFQLFHFDVDATQAQGAPAVLAAAVPDSAARGASPPGGTSAPSDTASARSEPEPVDYEVDLDLDFVQSTYALDPDLPFGSGATVGLTDMLGDHQVYLHVSQSNQEFSIDRLNLGVSYANLSHRINTSFGLFRLNTNERLTSLRPTQIERRTGGFAGVTYPFSTFDRLEVSAVGRYLERHASFQLPGEPGQSWLLSGFVSFVHDNSLWTWNGPVRGTRYNVTVGQTFDVLGRGFDRQTLQLDYRRYFELTRGVVFATRLTQRLSFGNDQQFFYVGGPNDLRGYDWYEFFGERLTLANAELRFPLIERIALRFPFGLIDFPSLRGGLFLDAANVGGEIYDTGWVGSFGASLGMVLVPPLVARVDFARRTDFDHVEPVDVDFALSFMF